MPSQHDMQYFLIRGNTHNLYDWLILFDVDDNTNDTGCSYAYAITM